MDQNSVLLLLSILSFVLSSLLPTYDWFHHHPPQPILHRFCASRSIVHGRVHTVFFALQERSLVEDLRVRSARGIGVKFAFSTETNDVVNGDSQSFLASPIASRVPILLMIAEDCNIGVFDDINLGSLEYVNRDRGTLLHYSDKHQGARSERRTWAPHG